MWLGQRRHSSYDASHRNTLNESMASVRRYYAPFVKAADILVWHEGDLGREDADALEGSTNVRWCLLRGPWWGRPTSQLGVHARDTRWSEGYLSMIRWYAVTSWSVLEKLGYEWVARFDDDSFLLSPIRYDLFDAMRREDRLYGYRSLARECDRTFGAFVDDYLRRASPSPREDELGGGGGKTKNKKKDNGNKLTQHLAAAPVDDGTIFCEKMPRRCEEDGRTPPKELLLSLRERTPPPYCEGPGRLGFYNNFFVTKIAFWLSDGVTAFRRAFDDSALIFSHRANDLIFQTATVRLLLPRARWRRFADFSYLHHTVRDGVVRWGGLETGYDDPHPQHTVDDYLARWHPPESLNTTQRPRHCDVQLALNDSAFRRVLIVPHGQTRFKKSPPAAPYCNLNGVATLW